MSKFACISVNNEGQKVQSTQEAVSILEVSSSLRNRGLTPVSIKEIKPGSSGGQALGEVFSFLKGGRIKDQQVADFFRQLATMLHAGVSLSDCLESLSSQAENPHFSRLLTQVREYIAWGKKLSEAFSEYPRVFPLFVIEMIAVGEETGSLDQVTGDVAAFLEGQIELKKKVKEATRYPMFVTGFFLVAVGVMVFYLIPQFKAIFDSYGASLPPLTLFVLNASDFLIGNLPYEIAVVVGLGLFALFYLRTAKGKGLLDRMKLKLPLVAKLTSYLLLARICRTLGLLLQSGVLLMVALDHTAAVAGNVVVESAIREIRKRIVEGSTLAQEMSKHSFFPPMVVGMARTGEQTGTLSEILPKVADFYDRELNYQLKALISILEPCLIIGLGVMVAFFVLSMYYPIFTLGDAIS